MRSLFEVKDNYYLVQNAVFSSLETIGGAIFIKRETNTLNLLKAAFLNLKAFKTFYFIDRDYGTCTFFHSGSNFSAKQVLIRNCTGLGRAIAASQVENIENNTQQTNYSTISQVSITNDCLYIHLYGNIQFNNINGSFLKGEGGLAPHAGYLAFALYQSYCYFTDMNGRGVFYHQAIKNQVTINHIVLIKNHPIEYLATSGKYIEIYDSIFFDNDNNNLNNIKVINCQFDKTFGSAQSEGCILIDKYDDKSLYGACFDLISLIQNSTTECSEIIHDYSQNLNRFMKYSIFIAYDMI